MPDVKTLLNTIWSRFRSAGVASEDLIIEHLAALLTEDNEQSSDIDLQLRKQVARGDLELGEIKRLLDEAVENVDETLDIAGKKAALFDRHILFRPQQISNGYYPTPRHIAQYMRSLVQLDDTHTLVDFACGSGGLLVERKDSEQRPKEIIGIDISPDWAKLAWVNTRLHGETAARVIVKDALRAMKEELANRHFERILMNPPFGGTVNAALAKDVVGFEISESTVALTLLVLQALAEGGLAAVLVPNGILFSGASGARKVRDLLIGRDEEGNFNGDYDLKALISLPPDALKPFSAIATHILLIQKRKANQEYLQQNTTWFFRPATDGYEAGNRRDVLTAKPEEQNELTLVEHMLKRYGNQQEDDRYLPEDNPLLVIKKVSLGDKQGLLIEAINGTTISRVAHCSQRGTAPAFFLIEFTQPNNEQGTYYVQLPIQQDSTVQAEPTNKGYDTIRNEEEHQKLLQKLYQVSRDRDVPPSQSLLEKALFTQAIAMTNGHGLLGVAVSTRGIMSDNLQPSQYVHTISDLRESTPPAKLLGQVYTKQAAFLQQVNGLLGRIDQRPIAELELPSPLAREKDAFTDEERDVMPFPDISREQQAVWKCLCKVSEQHSDKNGLFSLKDIIENGVEEKEARLTLELFEWMGIIVPVTIVDPNKRQSIKTPLFRRVTKRDLWDEQ